MMTRFTILNVAIGRKPRRPMVAKSPGGVVKMDVRGFIGLALIGRTQTWVRME